MIHNVFLVLIQIDGLINFIKAGQIYVSFVTENFKLNGRTHISLSFSIYMYSTKCVNFNTPYIASFV